jgi:hypothetical protein
MNRRDMLLAKLSAKQRIEQVVAMHAQNFMPPQPQQPQQQEMNNVASNQRPAAQPQPPAPNQPDGLSSDNGLTEQP